jgi:hypothetical protein
MFRDFRSKASVLRTLIFLFPLLIGCGDRGERATPQLLSQIESDFRSSGIHDYRIVVDVERPGELRRNDITVVQDRVQKGIVLYWEPKEKRWDNLITLNESQAIAFTFPGLVDTVKSEMDNPNRPVVRVVATKTSPYIKKIILGQIRQNNQPVPDSQATITVQSFQKTAH